MRFGRKRREDKLYKQWVKHVGLPPEAIPKKEASGDILAKGEKNIRRPRILYILLGVSMLILCVGLGLLLLQSC